MKKRGGCLSSGHCWLWTGLVFIKAALLKTEIEYRLYLYVQLQLWIRRQNRFALLWLRKM